MTGSDRSVNADQNMVERDYAMMRLEYMMGTDLVGYTEDDLKPLSESFHSAQRAIMVNCSDTKLEFQVTVDFENKMKSVLTRLRSQQCAPVKQNNENISAKLPKIHIKPFDGKLENWISFIQLFNSLIHQRDIPNIEKLHYLLTSVQGSALDLIKNYPVSNESYIDAYNALNLHYNKKRQIAFAYYEKMLYCEQVKSKSAVELEKVHRTFKETLQVLEKLCLPDRNFMLFHLLWSKLDKSTREAFQLEFNSNEIPDFQQLQEFIEKQIRALEVMDIRPIPNRNLFNKSNNGATFNHRKPKTTLVVTSSVCEFCSDQHSLASCDKFLKLDPTARFKFIKNKGLCVCCFSNNHKVKQCQQTSCCDVCGYSHHSLLHFNKSTPKPPVVDPAPQVLVSGPSGANIALTTVSNSNTVLFATARVAVKDSVGQYHPARALLDCASACNFISEQCAKRLGLKISQTGESVSGIGNAVAQSKGSLLCSMKPMGTNETEFKFEALVLPTICADQPCHLVDFSNWSHIKDLCLADPDFANPGPIDLLLNADIFASSLANGRRHGSMGQPKAIETIFGWIIMGECDESHMQSFNCRHRKDCFFVSSSSQSNLSLDSSLKRFWELENISSSSKSILSKEDQLCEDTFVENFRRTSEGRFEVPLPFVDPTNKPMFSNTREIAMRRLLSLERKLSKHADFRKAYVSFMDEYETSGHMEEVKQPSVDVGNFNYIPHHAVLRPDSVSTPLRAVFDASCRDSNGLSLNDTLLAGPKLQANIFDILTRFRWHNVVFTGDIKAMYRQILVSDKDAEYQRILWRRSTDSPVKDFKLTTVTYGVKSAPYQALRSIAQLAKDTAVAYPTGSLVLGRDIYVDDVVTGADSIEQALLLRSELSRILSSGGFHLRKWTSNHKKFIADLPASELYSSDFKHFDEVSELSLKILGLSWRPQIDSFQFEVSTPSDQRCTKRTILSNIARIYDPLGFLCPVAFHAKYLMQVLWSSGIHWDDDVSEAIAVEWTRFKSQLSLVESIIIPRRIVHSFVSLQLHGFCDASERGYAAVIYCRVVAADGSIFVEFCCAKSKVAPLRRLSIPRLELQAAVLLSDLMLSVQEALRPLYIIQDVVAWSDSSVALAWIQSCPSRWKTFVANRVSHIQEIIAPDRWRHVGTLSNPADVGSRGMLPADLIACELWWKGPSWLLIDERNWPLSSLNGPESSSTLEEQRICTLISSNTSSLVDVLLDRFSSLFTLKRVLAYCFRFCRLFNNKIVGPLQTTETTAALMFLLKHVQLTSFSAEITHLKDGRVNLLPKSLRKLSLFIDAVGIVRVGGRLANSPIKFSVKHPVLLPRSHRLTVLIIEEYHKKFLHPGAQTLQNLLAQSFWILSPKRAIRAVVGGCVKCFRAHPTPASAPLMGNLPSYRISQIKPFSSVAIDYGGPFDIALGRGRGVRTYKGYICVFVCTSTKAIHIELASELSTEAFLCVLKRFIARRGRCNNIVSDQGRNFIGASNYLGSLMKNATNAQEIKFSFNPPGSPHFNGLAESGIRSVKTHLARVVGNQRLTFEEFYTVLTQIEAMLNSRPLTPLSTDPNDLSAITPGHFLTLEPLSILPEEDFADQNVSISHRWKLIQKMHQDFWRRWHSEYVHTLQQRTKWNKVNTNILVGTLVLLINEQTSPLKWTLGRISALHPGSDGVCRVVTVRTATGHYKRPVVKLCPLPMSN